MQEAAKFAGPVVEGKRVRKVLRGYNEDAAWNAARKRALEEAGSSDDSDDEGGGKRRRRGGKGDAMWEGEGQEDEEGDSFQEGGRKKKVRRGAGGRGVGPCLCAQMGRGRRVSVEDSNNTAFLLLAKPQQGLGC